MEHMQCDDELVYSTATALVPVPVPVLHVPDVPELFVTRKLGGRKPLVFESLFVGCYCEGLVDSGASHSFVSVEFCKENPTSYV
jgi:hypothetical protein